MSDVNKENLKNIKVRWDEWMELRNNPDYYNVLFNSNTGALQATHREHRFDKIKGHYEMEVVNILYQYGHKIILESENKSEGIKTPDGTLNESVFEIKAVEGTGKNNIKNKFNEALSQGCAHVVLYFPDASICNMASIRTGYTKYKGIIKKEGLTDTLEHIWIITNGQVIIFK